MNTNSWNKSLNWRHHWLSNQNKLFNKSRQLLMISRGKWVRSKSKTKCKESKWMTSKQWILPLRQSWPRPKKVSSQTKIWSHTWTNNSMKSQHTRQVLCQANLPRALWQINLEELSWRNLLFYQVHLQQLHSSQVSHLWKSWLEQQRCKDHHLDNLSSVIKAQLPPKEA